MSSPTEDVNLDMPSYDKLEGSAMSRRKRLMCVGGVALLALAAVAGTAVAFGSGTSASDGPAPSLRQPRQCSLASGDHEIPNPDGSSKNRRFKLVVPDAGLTDQSTIVYVWHGLSSSPDQIATAVGLTDAANENGWGIVYPYSANWDSSTILAPTAFNGAGCCSSTVGADTLFAEALKHELVDDGCGDGSKFFTTGFSNGGFMSYRLACEAHTAGMFAAFAPHSGLMGDYNGNLDNSPWSSCEANVNMLAFHGDADSVVPINGGNNPSPIGSAVWFSYERVMEAFMTASGCGEESEWRSPFLSGDHTCVSRAGCNVQYCTAAGHAHTWLPDATAAVVDFFQQHGAARVTQ